MFIRVYLAYLYAGSRVLSTQAAGQSPAAGGDVGHLGNGLHLLWTAYTHLQGTQQVEILISDTKQSTLCGD